MCREKNLTDQEGCVGGRTERGRQRFRNNCKTGNGKTVRARGGG